MPFTYVYGPGESTSETMNIIGPRGKYPHVLEKLKKDCENLYAFYDLPTGKRQHLRKIKSIKSVRATAGHRNTRNCVLPPIFPMRAFKLNDSSEVTWRRNCEADGIVFLLNGVPHRCGIQAPDNPPEQ
jgi:hypothetical protein